VKRGVDACGDGVVAVLLLLPLGFRMGRNAASQPALLHCG